MQDLLVYVTRGISAVTTHLRSLGQEISAETNHLITVNLFTTITNANFDKEMIVARIHETLDTKETALKSVPGHFRTSGCRSLERSGKRVSG